MELLRDVKIPSPEIRIKEYPHQMSGGMRQRVMIAMAIACNPALLIADEPTTALDVTIQAQILELLQGLRQERKMSVLLITHDLGIISENAKRVAIMYAGRIAELTDVNELFSNPRHPYTMGLLDSLPKERASLLILYRELFRVLTGFLTAASLLTGAGLLSLHVKKESLASGRYQQKRKLRILQDA